MCNLNQIECDKHFILWCQAYQEHRIKIVFTIMRIDPQLPDWPVECIFLNIMSSTNDDVIFNLGKFIEKCFKMHHLVNGVAVWKYVICSI